MTPLMFAAENYSLDMVKMLLDAKAEVNVQTTVSESDGVLFKKYIYVSIYDDDS
jgi:ankyrin repeat protein